MPTRARSEWSTWPELRDRLRRRWERGDLLAAHAAGAPFEPLDVPIRGPGPRDLGERFDEVRAWRAGWSGVPRGVRLVEVPVGGRLIGVNRLPGRVVVDTWADLCAVLGVQRDVAGFDRLLAETRERAPRIAEWMVEHPLRALDVAAEWQRLVDTVLWIEHESRPGSYLREIDVPGVDTKFVETHRRLLADLLDRQLPPERIHAHLPRGDFAGRYGFRDRPEYVRVRLPPGHTGPFSEFAVRVEELAGAPLDAATVVVIENEITYLAMPPRPGTAVLLGGGYAVGRLAPLRWLSDRDVHYWGDIDTHGLAILDRLRASFPHVRSLLMDRATLLAHRSQWVREAQPTRAALPRLSDEEAQLHAELVDDVHGPSVRLEQERVRISEVPNRLGA
jgi:hypothetical protein